MVFGECCSSNLNLSVPISWEENQKDPTRSAVSRELIKISINQLEVPTDDENAITIIND